jgi:hypothetical protein
MNIISSIIYPSKKRPIRTRPHHSKASASVLGFKPNICCGSPVIRTIVFTGTIGDSRICHQHWEKHAESMKRSSEVKHRIHTILLIVRVKIADDFSHPIEREILGIHGENTTLKHVICTVDIRRKVATQIR